ncbi:hypothetical protein GGS20DRAFT_568277, partial [Poronia punctata]
MLSTWRLNSKSGNETQRQGFDPVTAKPIVQQACQNCRVKKLRCSGEKTGCCRCKTLSRDCVYAQIGTRGPRRSQKNKEHASRPQEGTRATSRQLLVSPCRRVNTSPTPLEPTIPIAPKTLPPQADKPLSASNGPISETPMAAAQFETPGNIMSLDFDIPPPEALDFLPAQSLTAVQMTTSAESWPVSSWVVSSQQDQVPQSEIPRNSEPPSSSITSPSSTLMDRWYATAPYYEDAPLIRIYSQSVYFSDAQTNMTYPSAQVVASNQCGPMGHSSPLTLEDGGVDGNDTGMAVWAPRHEKV